MVIRVRTLSRHLSHNDLTTLRPRMHTTCPDFYDNLLTLVCTYIIRQERSTCTLRPIYLMKDSYHMSNSLPSHYASTTISYSFTFEHVSREPLSRCKQSACLVDPAHSWKGQPFVNSGSFRWKQLELTLQAIDIMLYRHPSPAMGGKVRLLGFRHRQRARSIAVQVWFRWALAQIRFLWRAIFVRFCGSSRARSLVWACALLRDLRLRQDESGILLLLDPQLRQQSLNQIVLFGDSLRKGKIREMSMEF